MNKLTSGYGKDLSALGALLLSDSPSVIYLGEDRIHTPRHSMDAVSKEKWIKYIE